MTVRRTHQVGGVQAQPGWCGRWWNYAGALKPRVGEDQVGGDETPADEAAGAVDIGQDQVEQFRALCQAGLDAGPLAAAEQHGHRVELPGPVQAVGCTVDIVGGTVTAQHPDGVALALLQYLRAHALQFDTTVFKARLQAFIERELGN